jgi:paraquat-inducible protein A
MDHELRKRGAGGAHSVSDRPSRQRLATATRGAYVLIGPALLILLLSFPVVLFVPLLTTSLWFFDRSDITLAHAAYELFDIDKFLFAVVVVFGIAFPSIKMMLSVLFWYCFTIPTAVRYAGLLGSLSKLSMLDVMLLAIFVIAFKGVGVGTIRVEYGLYIYTLVVLGSLIANLAMSRAIRTVANARTDVSAP